MKSTCKKTMESKPKTQRNDQMEELRKMERSLKDDEPKKHLNMTPRDQILEKLQTMKTHVAFSKLTLLNAESALDKDKAHMGKLEAQQKQAELARMQMFQMGLEEAYLVGEAELEDALQRKVYLPNDHTDSDLIPEAEMAPNSHVANPISGNEEQSGESPKGENESDLAQEETAVEDDMTSEEAETDDDVRHKAFFAKLGVVMAQIDSVIDDLKVLHAQTEAIIKKHDEMKADALGEV